MEDKKKTPDVIIEDESEQEDVLDKFDNIPKEKEKKKKTTVTTRTLICSLCVAVVLAAIMLTLIFMPKDKEEKTVDSSASVTSKLDENNVWQADIKTENGEIKQNGSGKLLTLVPADIKTIKLENDKGTTVITSYTPTKKVKDSKTGKKVDKTEQTQYTVKGFEKYDLQSGEPDQIANTCSTLQFTSVSCVDAGDKLADFGFDDPRSIAKITYSDGTKSIIKVGDKAPQNMGTYVMFGSGNAVFLCDTDTVEHLLYGITDLVSLTINDAAADTESSEFKKVTLRGKNFNDKVVLEPNNSSEIDCDYVITFPGEVFADNTEASSISGGIRGLFADKVKAVNPNAAQLKKLGFYAPYAEIKAVYSDTTIHLIAAAPDSDNNCLLMEKSGSVVYKISADKIAWVNSGYEKLVSEYVLNVDLKSVSSLTVDGYRFDVTTKTVNTTDDEGEVSSTTETTTKYNGKKLDEGNFETLFKNISLLTKRDKKASSPKGNAELKVTYAYSSGRSSDKLAFYKSSGAKHIVTINGKPAGTVSSSYVEKLKKQAKSASKDDDVKSFW